MSNFLYDPKLTRWEIAELLKPKTEERSEMLITELLGETVKIREAGYKTMRKAVVAVEEEVGWDQVKREAVPTGNYIPKFNYEGEARTNRVDRIMRLDVLTFDGWRTVWDEGVRDLNPWERLKPSGSAKPTGKKYKTGSEAL